MLEFYPKVEYPLAATQLVLAMAGMGATLTFQQFREIAGRPQPVGLVLVMQYVVFPVLAAITARLAGLPEGIAIGLVLMNAIPSGSLTNVFTFLGHGNIAMSIMMTCASTALCFLATPLAMTLLTAAEGVTIPIDQTLYPIVKFLLLPLCGGMLVARYWSKHRHAFAKWTVRASLVPLLLIVVGALGSGRIDVTEYGLGIPVLIVVFIVVSLLSTSAFGRMIGYQHTEAFTMAIEVGMRNGGLGIALAASFFPAVDADNPVGGGVLFAVLFYAGAVLVVAGAAVIRRRLWLAWTASA